MPVTRVNCTVDSCVFWEKNNLCGATEITVAALSTDGRSGRRDMEVGAIGESKVVNTSSETQCVTFKPRRQR